MHRNDWPKVIQKTRNKARTRPHSWCHHAILAKLHCDEYTNTCNSSGQNETCNLSLCTRQAKAEIQRSLGPYLAWVHLVISKGFISSLTKRSFDYELQCLILTRCFSFSSNFTRLPHLAGTKENLHLAQQVQAEWKEFGLDSVQLVHYDVLLSYPDETKPNYISIIDDHGNEVQKTTVFANREQNHFHPLRKMGRESCPLLMVLGLIQSSWEWGVPVCFYILYLLNVCARNTNNYSNSYSILTYMD